MNVLDRDRQLLWMLDTVDGHEAHARAALARASEAGDVEVAARWEQLLVAIRRERDRVQARLLDDVDTGGPT